MMATTIYEVYRHKDQMSSRRYLVVVDDPNCDVSVVLDTLPKCGDPHPNEPASEVTDIVLHPKTERMWEATITYNVVVQQKTG